ncbi:MAG: hypothetical protein OXI30_06940 [Chloroflexota bacterium]|nr:hypothetical protein [Chloroflexota bacterium]
MIVAYRSLNVFFLLALLLLIPASTVHAADIKVNETCSLADAIAAANEDEAKGGCQAGDGADVIFLTSDVVLSAELPVVVSEITVEGNGYAISGDLSHRIFSVGDTAFSLNHIKLRDGRSDMGSAIHAWNATIAINNSRLEGNVAFGRILAFGGAIQCWPCDLVITNSVLRNNSASGLGGAIYFSVCCDAGQTLHISNSMIEKNNAETGGGGIYIGGLDPAQVATIFNSAFADNWTNGDGGGIYRSGHPEEWSGKLVIENSTFFRNQADSGGALLLDKNTLNTLRHVTMVDNDAIYGSSIHAVGRGITDLYSSIVARDYLNELCYGALSVISHSIIEDGSCDSSLEGDALLGGLIESADESPGYFPLLPGSPAIDAVDCDRGITTDQIGTPRPQGALCDLGAIEYIPDDFDS